MFSFGVNVDDPMIHIQLNWLVISLFMLISTMFRLENFVLFYLNNLETNM